MIPPARSRPILVVKDAAAVVNKPGKTNWVEERGGLPGPIADLAGDLVVGGMEESHAIATAISRSKVFAVTVKDPAKRAKWAAAVARWEAMKVSKGYNESLHPRGPLGRWVLSGRLGKAIANRNPTEINLAHDEMGGEQLRAHTPNRVVVAQIPGLRSDVRHVLGRDSAMGYIGTPDIRPGMTAAEYRHYHAPRKKKWFRHPPAPSLVVAKAADHQGAMVALYPSRYARDRLKVDGGEPARDMHVTLAYLGDASGVDDDTLQRVVSGVAAHTPPLRGRVGGQGKFTGTEENVHYAAIDCPGLSEHRERLAAALRDAGLPVSEDHGFTPHMTLQYGGDGVPSVENRPLRFDAMTAVMAGAKTHHVMTGVRKDTMTTEDLGGPGAGQAPLTVEQGGKKKRCKKCNRALPCPVHDDDAAS